MQLRLTALTMVGLILFGLGTGSASADPKPPPLPPTHSVVPDQQNRMGNGPPPHPCERPPCPNV